MVLWPRYINSLTNHLTLHPHNYTVYAQPLRNKRFSGTTYEKIMYENYVKSRNEENIYFINILHVSYCKFVYISSITKKCLMMNLSFIKWFSEHAFIIIIRCNYDIYFVYLLTWDSSFSIDNSHSKIKEHGHRRIENNLWNWLWELVRTLKVCTYNIFNVWNPT